MDRMQRILGGLLLVQVVLILLVRTPFSDASARVESQALLPGLADASPTRLEIRGKEDEKLTLARQDDRWALEQIGGFPADTAQVDKLIEDLENLRVRRPVVSSGRYHEAFQVADGENEGRVQAWAEGSDEPIADLILGSSPNYRALHVRRGGEDPVYEVQGIAAYDVRAEAGAWVDKQLVEIQEDELVGLRVTNAKGTFELDKRDGQWVVVAPAGKEHLRLEMDKIDALVRAASNLRIADPIGVEQGDPAQGAAATLVVRWRAASEATVEGEDSPPSEDAPVEELTIWVGDKLEDKDTQRTIHRSGFGFASSIWESSVRSVLEDSVDDLLATAQEAEAAESS